MATRVLSCLIASIKPRLLFSHSDLVSWGLPFLQFIIYLKALQYRYSRIFICFCLHWPIYVYRQLPPVQGQWLAGGEGPSLRLFYEDAIMINRQICVHCRHTQHNVFYKIILNVLLCFVTLNMSFNCIRVTFHVV